MSGEIERRARLARIGPRHVRRIVEPRGGVHAVHRQQHVDIAERVIDRVDHPGAALLRAHVFAGGEEGAAQNLAAGRRRIVARPLAQPFGVHLPPFRMHDHPLRRHELLQARELHVPQFRAFRLQHPRDFIERRRHLGVCHQVGLVEMAHEADAQPARTSLEIGAEPARRHVAGERVKQRRGVGDRACHRPDVIEREGKGKDALAGDQVVGRLQTDHSAEPGGAADRAAGVRAHRERREPRGERRARA